MRRGFRYTFPDWCEANVGGRGAAAVHAWLSARGVPLSRQAVAKLLDRTPRDLRLKTWRAICDATGRPLSYFIEYVPASDEPREPLGGQATRPARPQAPQRLVDRRPALPPRFC
jgi:hypothetical protein